jgi:hypothetical protein
MHVIRGTSYLLVFLPVAFDLIVSGKLWVERGGKHLTPNKEFEEAVKEDVEARVCDGINAVLEKILQEMTEHLENG